MFNQKKLLRAVIAVSLTSGLVACGGSSGGSSDNEEKVDQQQPQTQTGTFIDSPVGGLEYKASPSGTSGLTTDKGQFNYLSGDMVTFSIGNFNLGQTQGSELVTPLSLVPEAKGDTEHSKVSNIARFLQTLDDDGLADNGITISESVRREAEKQNPVDVADAALDSSAVRTAILAVASKTASKTQAIVTTEDAVKHLDSSLAYYRPVESCSDERAEPLTASRISGKTFGYIRDNELGIWEFNADTRTETSYDTERTVVLRTREESWTWNNGLVIDGKPARHQVCATANYLIFQDGEEVSKFYDIQSYSLPNAEQTFLIEYRDTGNSALLTVSADGSLEYGPAESPISASSEGRIGENGALELDFDENGVIDSVFFLQGQGKRTGIYLDYSEKGDLQSVGTATIVPDIEEANLKTFSGNTFIYRNTEENSLVIRRWLEDGVAEDIANDHFSDGEQAADYWTNSWSWQDGILEDGSSYRAYETATGLFLLELGGTRAYELHKTSDILENLFSGTYLVDIPTENSRFNTLVVTAGGQCTYSGTECTWSVESNGLVKIAFDGRDEFAQIWQISGLTNAYAFVMRHGDDMEDVEPGFMTRQ